MITWNVDPIIYSIGPIQLRWYSLAFFVGFLIGYQYFSKLYAREGRTQDECSRLLMYVFLGTIIGARLGHCLFYEPEYYLRNPIEIIAFWKGFAGLASHGGYLGVIIATFLYVKRTKGMSFFWVIDRLVGPCLLTGAFIRLGNLFNSEIVGRPSDVPWAVIFQRLDNIPRHPAQVYEAIGYFIIAMILFFQAWRYAKTWPPGRIFGVAMTLSFTFRFFIEFVKENQVDFETDMFLNMGQILSIPFVLFGIFLITGKQVHMRAFQFLMKKT